MNQCEHRTLVWHICAKFASTRILSRQMQLGETSGREHVNREMRTPMKKVVEKGIGILLDERQFIGLELE